MAREVGTEGKLGGQAEVKGVSGTWRDLTDNVNMMAATSPTRCATSPGDHRGGQRRPHARRSRSTPRARSSSSSEPSTRWSTSSRPSPTRSRAWRARWARRASWAARRGQGRVRHLARPDREREPAGGQPDHAGARHRRGVHRRDPGRPHPRDRRGGPRRGRGAQGHDQPDDRQPPRHHQDERRAGLAQDQPGPDLRPHAGPARPEDRVLADHVRADADGVGARSARSSWRSGERARADRLLRLRRATARRRARPPRRGPRRPGRAREGEHPHHRAAGRLHQDRVRPRRVQAGQHHRPAGGVRGARCWP